MSKIETYESYSNGAYWLAGIIGFLITGNALFLILMTLLSAGSFIYHQHKTGFIYKVDWLVMVAVVQGLAGDLFDSRSFWIATSSYIAVYSFFFIGRTNVYLEMGLASIPLIIGLFLFKPPLWAGAIIAVFLLALWVRSRDNHLNTRDVHYDSLYHTAWHIITAIGFLMIVL